MGLGLVSNGADEVGLAGALAGLGSGAREKEGRPLVCSSRRRAPSGARRGSREGLRRRGLR